MRRRRRQDRVSLPAIVSHQPGYYTQGPYPGRGDCVLTIATQATVVPAQPSFRRKPESRTLGSRLVLFREDFLDSGFRRNDGFMT